MTAYKLILAEDHIPLRQAIKKILREYGELSIVGEAGNGLELLGHLKKSVPDLVITDIFNAQAPWAGSH